MPPAIDWSRFSPVNAIVGGAMRWPNMLPRIANASPRLIAGGFCLMTAGLSLDYVPAPPLSR